jgi:deoxyhypusine synthase
VVGLDFDKFADRNITVAEMVESMTNMGFQATSVGQAAQIINGMVIDLETSQPTSRLTQGR